MSRTEELVESLRPLRDRLLGHPLYSSIASPEALCVFMEHHVFAVWDFMTLLKSLQRSLSCVELPWVPTSDSQSRRLINEIVLAEESDEDGAGGHASHFELYLGAMRQAKADNRTHGTLPRADSSGRLHRSGVAIVRRPAIVRSVLANHLGFVESGSIAAVASAFTLGREELIPDLFRGLLDSIEAREPGRVALFRHYLDRHVELDGDEHGPHGAPDALNDLRGRPGSLA